jgi:hypothetical protein
MFTRCVCLLLAMGSATTAMARPDTRTMSCAQAVALVRAQGAVVMSTGDFTYDRYVAGGAHCMALQITARATAPTADNPKCRVGFICRQQVSKTRD